MFKRAATQWRVGCAGLHYEAMPFVLELEAVPREDWPEVMSAVQVMERQAMLLWRERR